MSPKQVSCRTTTASHRRLSCRLLVAASLMLLPHESYEFQQQHHHHQKAQFLSSTHRIEAFAPTLQSELSSSSRLGSKRSSNDDDSPSTSIPEPFVNSSRSVAFSAIMAVCGALLGPFLDSYHSAFGVLQYDEPIKVALWGTARNPALITAWWVPVLFGVAGWLIGWVYIWFDVMFETETAVKDPAPPKILLGIAIFTFQYWLSGILVASGALDRTGILNAMSLYAAIGFWGLDGSMAGFLTSAATAIGGPLIEIGLLSLSRVDMMPGGYHYTDLGETGFFPLWIAPVYFLGGPAVGNLARGFWSTLGKKDESEDVASLKEEDTKTNKPGCKVCNDTRCVPCPNCDGVGQYVAMGNRTVKCTSCAERGFVICRACFSNYDEDPNDIEAIRELMSRMPD